MSRTILITGGAGFIGSALIRYIIANTTDHVVNLDKLTYAGNLQSLAEVESNPRYYFIQADICDREMLDTVFAQYQPDAVMHLAAESHVDRAISGPADFIQSNIIGTYTLLEATRAYYQNLPAARKNVFRFHHISTDEVYGELDEYGAPFTEQNAYAPRNPYAASKASADHLVRAWYRTYGLPVLITNSSNNYGPYHFPEKLIPLVILNALAGKPLPVYGEGQQIRDWLYVEDHATALYRVITAGRIGETYNIGSNNQQRNIDVVIAICRILDERVVKKPLGVSSFAELITFVTDRPGHDKRYAIDAGKVIQETGWVPKESFESGLCKTVEWYLANSDWWQDLITD